MRVESVPRMVQLVVLASQKASPSLMRAESVPSMVRLVVLPSPKASPSLMRAESVPSMVRLVVLPSPKASNSLKIKNTFFLCESLQPLFDHPPFRLCAA